MPEFLTRVLSLNHLPYFLIPVIVYGLFLLIKRKLIVFRDVLLLCGFFLLGFGLWLFMPCLSFSVCGVLLMCAGYFMSEK